MSTTVIVCRDNNSNIVYGDCKSVCSSVCDENGDDDSYNDGCDDVGSGNASCDIDVAKVMITSTTIVMIINKFFLMLATEKVT